jgi:integrase
MVHNTIISNTNKITSLLEKSEYKNEGKRGDSNSYSLLFERKIANAAAGLSPEFHSLLTRLPKENALNIASYIESMRSEVNPSDHYRESVIKTLSKFLTFLYSSNDKRRKGPIQLREITREEILAFLDSYRRPESMDPLHRWIGTYNIYRMNLMRFFKWLYYPDITPEKRPNPQVIENISRFKRKEQSIYGPNDLWTAEEDLIFFKYCPSKRMKCYHAIARDLACRPHEILKLKIKDVAFKAAENKQYAEVTVNSGKTGTRSLPLIDSIPYLKDYLNHEHPQPGNPNAILISGTGKSLGRAIGITALAHIYRRYKTNLFPRLLNLQIFHLRTNRK